MKTTTLSNPNTSFYEDPKPEGCYHVLVETPGNPLLSSSFSIRFKDGHWLVSEYFTISSVIYRSPGIAEKSFYA